MDKIKYIGATSPWRDDLTGSGLTWTTGQEANVADHVGNVARGYTSHFQMMDDGVKVTADSSGTLYRDDTQSPVSGVGGITLPDGTTVVLAPVPLLSSSALPLAIPSSGSVGNNGALTGLTSLAGAYAAAGMYLYFPAGAIAAGSAAGWYYTVMSSTSTGTIYNNTYTSGTPRVPATLTAFATTGPGAYTQSTSAIGALQITVPGGWLGPAGNLYIDGIGEANNNANSKQITMFYGGAQFGAKQLSGTAVAAFNTKLQNISEVSQILLPVNSSLSGSYSGGGTSSGVISRAAVNTANDQTLLIRMKLDNAADWLMLSAYSVLVHYAE